MKRVRLVLWVPLIAFLVCLAVFAAGLGAPQDKTTKSALIDQPLPQFTLQPAMAGRPGLSTADFRRGQPMVVNIFASWCIPCRAEAPQLEQLARRGVPLVGIAIRDRPQDLAQFLATYGDPFRAIGADVDRRVQLDIGSAGVPETFVIDGRGVVRHQHIGVITDSDVPAIVAAWEAAR
ncbi:MAG TPA: DsbE family thiol:disulfide interchange protein [Allosphingosinicella sp.]|nr:DsbE family thiol:disulfide interchange protein [Allosphingosinicella sp.]